jgi:outer membrane lipopolysaccharide assembly protein LptE/RlpB
VIRGCFFLLPLALFLCSCGYHVSGKADLIPKSIQTIAIPPFTTNATQYQLPDELANATGREFTSRTRFTTVKDAATADAVLSGNINSVYIVPTVSDPNTGKATSVQIVAVLNVKLVQRATGRVLYSRPNFQVRTYFEIATDQHQYFDESGPAYDRLSRTVAQDIVSAVIENF